jgi:peroxiredoxin
LRYTGRTGEKITKSISTTKTVFMKKILFVFLLLHFGAAHAQRVDKVLKATLAKINTIESAAYQNEDAHSAPGDTSSFVTSSGYFKTITNNDDPFVGAKYIYYNHDSTQIKDCYDGDTRINLNWEKQKVKINRFDGISEVSTRGVILPFFPRAKALINHALSHRDSTNISMSMQKDTIFVHFSYANTLLEFSNIEPVDYKKAGAISRYVLAVDKKTYLPLKLVRKMPHQTSIYTYKHLQLNTLSELDFSPKTLIPVGFELHTPKDNEITTYKLEKQKALDWKLKEVSGDTIKYESFKNKVLLIEFTALGCGPCINAVPFLKEMNDKYKDQDFELISIELSAFKEEAFARYKEKHQITYPYLMADKETEKNYLIKGYPAFFIIGKDGIVEKVKVGYIKDKTDKEIKEVVHQLLSGAGS